MPSDDHLESRTKEILASLEALDVTGGNYPRDVTEPQDRLRWNQSQLVTLVFYHAFEPTMLVGEYSQERWMMAGAIYRQSTSEFPTGTLNELALEITLAVVHGWL